MQHRKNPAYASRTCIAMYPLAHIRRDGVPLAVRHEKAQRRQALQRELPEEDAADLYSPKLLMLSWHRRRSWGCARREPALLRFSRRQQHSGNLTAIQLGSFQQQVQYVLCADRLAARWNSRRERAVCKRQYAAHLLSPL